MISICARTFDLLGDFLFTNYYIDIASDDIDSISRRVTRTKTLDGGVYINDNGYTASDKEVAITIMYQTKAQSLLLRDLVANHGEVTISRNNEVLLCVPERYTYNSGNVQMRFLAKELLS